LYIYSAEHGIFLKAPQNHSWLNLLEGMDLSWKNDVLPIFEYYTERTPGSFVEHKSFSLTWHYRLSEPLYGSWQAKECQTHLENTIVSKLPVEVLTGKKNIEVRPISMNKGEAIKKIMSLHPKIDFIFCVGDDRTDEDMFRVLKGPIIHEKTSFTCTVGYKKSQAQYYLKDCQDLIQLMVRMREQS
jgi:trehalose-phosphatase